MYIAFCETEARPTPPGAMYDKVRSCGLKVNFLTAEKAQTEADLQTKLQKTPFVSYKCRWCAFHHIGHQPGTKKKIEVK